MKTRWIGMAMAGWGLMLASCGSDESQRPPASTTGPTYYGEVRPILEERCVGCHTAGGIAPFPLTTYAEVAAVADLVAEATHARTMPPWGAFETDECKPPRPFLDDGRLSTEEIDALGAWAAAGAPAGEEPTEAHVPPSPEGGIGAVDLELSPATGYVTSGDFDELRCFVLDPGLTEEVYLAAQEIIPGNPEVVHHVNVYLDPNRESAFHAGPDGSYDCFGGPLLSSAELVGAWVPGSPGLELPADVGLRVPAGSLFVMQVHYHPSGPDAAPDATTMRLRFADATPKYRAEGFIFGNFPAPFGEHDGLLPGPDDDGAPIFRIRAGASGHVESMRLTLSSPGPLRVWAAGNHMHYLGTDMRTSVVHAEPKPGEPAEECLLQTPRWSFSWQRGYVFDAPIEALPELRAGDVLELRCTYDNSFANPQVVEALHENGVPQPVDVFLGEQSLDEMCNVGLIVIVPNL